MKKKNLITVLLTGTTIICIGTAVFCNYKVKSIESVYEAAETVYTTIAENYAPDLVKTKEQKQSPANNKASENPKSEETVPEAEKKTETVWTVDFDGLESECKFGSVAGWLLCEGTQINYPVMQCDDNNYYLHRLSNGEYNFSGSLYTDFRCAEDFMGTNTIIYGHNMASGAMFGELHKYIDDPAFFEEHPDMILITPNGNYKLEVFSAFVSITEDENVWKFEFPNDDDYSAYLNYLKSSSKIPSGPNINVSPADKIVTLMTCTVGSENKRTLVYGRLTEIS